MNNPYGSGGGDSIVASSNYLTEIKAKISFIPGQNGKYLQFVDNGSLSTAGDTDSPQAFYLELRDPTHMCIKNEAGKYVNRYAQYSHYFHLLRIFQGGRKGGPGSSPPNI